MPTSTILLHERQSGLPLHVEVYLVFTLSDFSVISRREGGSLSLDVFPFIFFPAQVLEVWASLSSTDTALDTLLIQALAV